MCDQQVHARWLLWPHAECWNGDFIIYYTDMNELIPSGLSGWLLSQLWRQSLIQHEMSEELSGSQRRTGCSGTDRLQYEQNGQAEKLIWCF